jgi:DNA repair exonuclease SbcCD nuclease subunit
MGLKVGIISDTHLGSFAIDSELNRDSFDAFEEGLRLLVGNGADIILHAGDFYHSADPQPWIQDQATRVLRSTITGKKPPLKLIEGKVNFEAEDVSIAVPVFIIHGTHDRPVGRPTPAPAFQHLVAAGYMNYIDTGTDNRFATRQVVIEKDGVKVSITGVGHRPEGDINRSICKSEIPVRRDCINFCSVHNCVEGIVPSPGEYINLKAFSDINYLIVGHAHQARLTNKTTIATWKVPDCLNTYLMVPGSTCATGIYPGEEGNKYVHLIEFLSTKTKPKALSFRLKTARRVFHGSMSCEGLSATETREKIKKLLSKLQLSGLEKKALLRLYLTGKLAAGAKKADLGLEEIEINYKDSVQNWNEMIVPSDLYTEDDWRKLEDLRFAIEGDVTSSAPFESFCQKLAQLQFRGRYFRSEEIFGLLSDVTNSTTARKRVLDKFNKVFEDEHS